MTPKQKAEDLVASYRGTFFRNMSDSLAKQCALVVVYEILGAHLFDLDEKFYWEQVEIEINNL
jgi:hypothetical protein